MEYGAVKAVSKAAYDAAVTNAAAGAVAGISAGISRVLLDTTPSASVAGNCCAVVRGSYLQ